MSRLVLVSLLALACAPPPPCPECPRTRPTVDAAQEDAGHSWPPSPADGGEILPDAGAAVACDEASREAWTDFFWRLDIVDVMVRCTATPLCEARRCEPGQCIAAAAGMPDCEPCVRAAITCAARECSSECGAGSSPLECRACMCRSGCTAAFEDCGDSDVDLCATCEGPAACGPFTPPPDVLFTLTESSWHATCSGEVRHHWQHQLHPQHRHRDKTIMNRKTLSLLTVLGLSTIAATAFALNNDNVTIREVEVTETQVLFHLTAPQTSRPACTTYSSMVGCELSSPSCEHMLSVGLAAQLSGRTVDMDVAASCIEGTARVARVTRLRAN